MASSDYKFSLLIYAHTHTHTHILSKKNIHVYQNKLWKKNQSKTQTNITHTQHTHATQQNIKNQKIKQI